MTRAAPSKPAASARPVFNASAKSAAPTPTSLERPLLSFHLPSELRCAVPLAPFRDLSDLELDALSDDKLVSYLAQARSLGHIDAARRALQILVYGHMDRIEARVRWKLGRKESQETVEKIAGEAFMSALFSMLSGASTGEFVSWLNTIVDRRIVDHLRKKRLETDPLAEEHLDDDVVGALPFDADMTGAIELQMIVDELRSELDEVHRLVVDLYCLEGHPAGDTADRINNTCPDLEPPMTENNVHAIASRFRRKLRERLADHSS